PGPLVNGALINGRPVLCLPGETGNEPCLGADGMEGTIEGSLVKLSGQFVIGLEIGLVGEICGSPIRSNGRWKVRPRSPRNRCGIGLLQLFPARRPVAFRTSLPFR